MHANEPVPRERLIDELWGDAAPKTVNAALSVYLSRLRRLLADGIDEQLLFARGAGYVLRVPPYQLDMNRFEALLEQGRQELASGEAERASRTLRDALALWRGPALADLASESFVQTEVARLEELRLTALEARIEADLALGRQDSLVAELETLVAAHPYREGLRAQLMLALYRSGRQAEALERYRRARRAFSEELGIEPGPRLQELERAILRHDPSIDLPAAAAPRAREEPVERARHSTRWAFALIGVLALAIAAAVVAAARDPSGSSPGPVELVGDSVAVIDPGTDTIVGEVPVGGRPTGPAVGEGSVWVGNRDDKTLLRIDSRSRRVVRTIGLGVAPTDVAVGAGSVWVLTADRDLLLRIEPATNDVVARVRLPPRAANPWFDIEVGAKAVWVCACRVLPGPLARVDVTTSVVSVREGPVGAIAFGEGAVWALTGYELDTVERIDPNTHTVVETIPFERIGAIRGYRYRIAAGAGAVWVSSLQALWRIDPAINRFTGSASLGRGGPDSAAAPQDLAIGNGAVWVTTNNGNLLRVDPESQRVAKTIPLGPLIYPVGYPLGDALAVGEGAVWVAVTSFAS